MVLAQPILFVASFEWRSRVAPFKPLKVTSTGKMDFVPTGFARIGPSFPAFVVEYAQHVLPPHTEISEPILANQRHNLNVNRPYSGRPASASSQL